MFDSVLTGYAQGVRGAFSGSWFVAVSRRAGRTGRAGRNGACRRVMERIAGAGRVFWA